MRLGICNELFEGWELAKVCRTVKALAYEGIEIAPFTLAPRITDLSRDQRREIRSVIEGEGLATIGLHWLLARTEGFHLTHPEATVRRRTADYLKALGEATADLGGTIMVLGSPKQRDRLPGVSAEAALGHAAEVLTLALPTIEDAGVDLCLEPLGPAETNFLNTIAEANALIDRIGHPALLLQLDAKAQSTDPAGTVPELFAHFSPAAGHVHVQEPDGRGPGFGPTDWRPILEALRESHYQRWVSVEAFDPSPGIEELAARARSELRPLLPGVRD